MELDEAIKILTANKTNRLITENLNPEITDFIISALLELDANDFKELNPNGTFEYGDIPIPYRQLNKYQNEQTTFSCDLQEHLEEILQSINTEGTNIEYPFVIRSEENISEYSRIKPF